MEVPKSYDSSEVEERWRDEWDDSLYAHDPDSDAPDYRIDTPPPYPTGNLHIGNALGWCYMDFVARYKRLQGYNVLFPQGWDCHGLPTEVKVEEEQGVHRSEVPRDEFRQMCIDHTYGQIDEMRDTMDVLGFSQDWSHEYITMEPEYWGKTQRSFLEMADDGYAYQGKHPVNWCPRCETAIADAEVEREEEEGVLVYLEFPVVGDDDVIEIATTRPELLPACGAVAVDPDDERFEEYVGEEVEVPIFGHTAEVIQDEEVDPEFGTGAVMICTFGDKQDVEWWQEYDIDLREAFTKTGELTEIAGEYEGMEIDEAKEAIIEDLEDEGYLYDKESLEQNVGKCWRCDTPIEILSKEQWFIEVRQDEILEKAEEVDWIPDHMHSRLVDWTEGMEWDWVISRQRVFATPFPVWYCDDCGSVKFASVDEVPVDPTEEDPETPCEDCGGTSFTPEEDVMDTWMDSSISAMHVAGWPEEGFEPTQLREQGHDIIRTWAFYTILRTAALEDEIPWEEALINGMVFGDDGHKMSKSRGNFVQPEEAVEEYSADAFRQSLASGGRPGSDIQFRWKEVKRASKFMTKLWNIYRFSASHITKDVYDYEDEAPDLRLADRWILSKLSETADEVEEAMDEHRFDLALKELREFVWDDVADDYVEMVKGRLYEEDGDGYEAVRWTLRTLIESVVVMFSPVAPFFSEEVYSGLRDESVNNADWPRVEVYDADALDAGELQAEIASSVRRWKSEEGIALNAELDRVEVYAESESVGERLDVDDLSDTLSSEVAVETGEPDLEEVPVGVDPDMSVIGPEYRDTAGEIVSALESSDPSEVREEKETGAVEVEVGDGVIELDSDAVGIENELRSGGREVEVIETDGATVLVFE